MSDRKGTKVDYLLHAVDKEIKHLHDLFDVGKDHISHHKEDKPTLIYSQICDIDIHRIYYDSGSSTGIMYDHCLSQLLEQIRKRMKQLAGHLTSFAEHFVWLKGIMYVPLT